MDSSTPPKSFQKNSWANRLKSQIAGLANETLGLVISRQKQKELLGTSIYRNAFYLVITNIVGPLTNFFFWIVVARIYATSDVGLASATNSIAALLGLLSTLGFEFGLVRYLANADQNTNRMVNTSFTLGSLTSVLFSIIFLAGVGSFSPALVPLRQNPLYICLFILFAIVMTMTILMSNVFVAQRHAKYTMIVNLISCTLQLVMILLLMPFTHSFSGIVAVFAFSGAIALIFGTIFLLPRTLKEYRPVPVINIGIVKEIIHFSFTNYVANMLWSFAIYLLPIMVVNLLNKESNAYFYIAWTMGAVLSTIAGATTNALFAEGSFDENQLGTNVWRCLKMTYFLLIPAALIVFLLADKLLLIYGTDYSSKGRLLLRLMCITALPLSMNSIYISILRVQKRTTLLILLSLVVAAITLITSYLLLPHLGITATGIGWLVSQSVVAIFVGCRLLKLRKTGQI